MSERVDTQATDGFFTSAQIVALPWPGEEGRQPHALDAWPPAHACLFLAILQLGGRTILAPSSFVFWIDLLTSVGAKSTLQDEILLRPHILYRKARRRGLTRILKRKARKVAHMAGHHQARLPAQPARVPADAFHSFVEAGHHLEQSSSADSIPFPMASSHAALSEHMHVFYDEVRLKSPHSPPRHIGFFVSPDCT